MFKFFKKAGCIAGVSSTLQSCGVDKTLARSIVDNHPEYFSVIIDMLKHLDAQPRNIVATIALIHVVLEETKTRQPEQVYEIESQLFSAQKHTYEALKYQLKTRPNWKEIAIALHTVMHIVLGEDMPTEQEIIQDFDPSKIEFSTY
ncbi:hypothetical protein L1D14_06590 [Vibrio tubiashii]|uniref:hypothetical protein n=1 Tax=Vibrio tubiashii TaxID=29498 RepID=UPI001EFEAB29|nr:hypothetical protein [Vibrio tubiashii]MCG9575908.1 hypothetical protein [Vibrio tubiashii]